MYYIYMLRCSDNSLYTGITNNMEKRYGTHVFGKTAAAKYTKSHTVTGIEAIWNFAPTHLDVPPGIQNKNMYI